MFLASVDMLVDMERERRQSSLRGAPDIRVGLYKGSHVAVRHVTRKHVELSRALKKPLLARKEMNHENINRLLTVCCGKLEKRVCSSVNGFVEGQTRDSAPRDPQTRGGELRT